MPKIQLCLTKLGRNCEMNLLHAHIMHWSPSKWLQTFNLQCLSLFFPAPSLRSEISVSGNFVGAGFNGQALMPKLRPLQHLFFRDVCRGGPCAEPSPIDPTKPSLLQMSPSWHSGYFQELQTHRASTSYNALLPKHESRILVGHQYDNGAMCLKLLS
jgi:hypothetical protein